MSLERLSENIDALLSNISEVIIDEAWKLKDEIIDANVEQMDIGMSASGNLFPYYLSDDYSDFKIAIGSDAPHGIPNMEVEGDFKRGMTAERGKDFIITFSEDFKAQKLERQYGEDELYGLNEIGESRVGELLIPGLQERFTNEITKGIR